MSPVGPALPPGFSKRKRSADSSDDEGSDPSTSKSAASSPGGAEKKRRILGPTMPSAPLESRPEEPPSSDSDSDSESEDGALGPALPPPPGQETSKTETSPADQFGAKDSGIAGQEKPKRESWMLEPPPSGDWASKIDPTKLKSRKFNTGKGAQGPKAGGADATMWTETPEQKRKRLEDEVMGVQKPQSAESSNTGKSTSRREEEETARRIKEYNMKHDRGQSLYNQHKKASQKEKEDDASARAFDWSKDMGGGQQIGHAKRKEMVNRASDLSSNFSKGSYL